ncbi:MAG: HD domain-containing protein [Lachnospiraceae bacterium]|nr:HD domain-containing protein [Lachnospiraceae bacterium]
MQEHNELIMDDFKGNLSHGINVANLSYLIAKEMELDEDMCYDIALSGFLHDIGKLQLSQYLYGRNKTALEVEEMKYMRMHSKLSYDIIQHYDLPYLVQESVLYHHENYDGSGYPENLKGDDIPLGARIIKVADTFAALISDRPYRKAFDYETAMELMIDEAKNYDIKIFLVFQRIMNTMNIDDIISKSVIDMDIDDIMELLA